MNVLLSKLAGTVILSVGLLIGLPLSLGAIAAAQSDDLPERTLAPSVPLLQNDLPDGFSIVTDTVGLTWDGISGDCAVFRDETGAVYLHRLPTQETVTITTKPEPAGPRKVVIWQGVVVWRSDRAGETGLWGYYDPACSDTNRFGAQPIGPFYIISRANAHTPALSGEMLTFDTWSPKGWWYVALVELDANDNNLPDAIEAGYDPTDSTLLTPLSTPFWQGERGQRFSDIYWGDTYKIACWFDNGAGVETIQCNNLNHLANPSPWIYSFTAVTNTHIPLVDWGGVLAVHRDLLVWTDARDEQLSGYDIHIIDLDLDDDGILNPDDNDFGEEQTEFIVVNRPWHQDHPDVWWPFVVWSDYRNGNQPDIYAYDLSLDSDGDGLPNWKDPNRFCIDPAEFPVALHTSAETTPEIWDGQVVWVDDRYENSLYGAVLTPLTPQPRPYLTGSPQTRATTWVDQATATFPRLEDLPGYVQATGLITRYKSFDQDDNLIIHRAWYPPITGSYVTGFDYCYFGTPNQKRYLGRFGRGFIYDQGLAMIARSMLAQSSRAEDIGRFMSGLQNSDQLTVTPSGSFGFSFNGQGYWGEKDNFYDMNYLRGGANGWLGYGYLFYDRRFGDTQFTAVATGIGDYILPEQILVEDDPRYGLFKGGYGGWHDTGETVEWYDGPIEWVSTEHNIDIYFFLRDLGRLSGDSRYTEAAMLLKDNMPKLWDETKGRLHQGMGPDGTLDTADALDAASWGAMYWLAVDDLEKAKRSLVYADQAYLNEVTVTNTVTLSPVITIRGYKPYNGVVENVDWSNQELVWSEGSLGVAMANLKLGYALANQCDAEGQMYIQKARNIVAQMEEMQRLDPAGGLFYTAYPGAEIGDFPRAPSAAGTLWLLMVQQALENQQWGDAFWGSDPAPVAAPGGGAYDLFLPLIMTSCF